MHPDAVSLNRGTLQLRIDKPIPDPTGEGGSGGEKNGGGSEKSDGGGDNGGIGGGGDDNGGDSDDNGGGVTAGGAEAEEMGVAGGERAEEERWLRVADATEWGGAGAADGIWPRILLHKSADGYLRKLRRLQPDWSAVGEVEVRIANLVRCQPCACCSP